MSHRVLVVDDSLAVGRQLTKMLDGLDQYQVVGHARDGLEAIKLFQALKPDVVLMDLVMPQMDGIQSMRTVLQLEPETKIVVITAQGGSGGKVEEAIRLGASNVISKPFDATKVASILDDLFKRM